MSYYEITFVLKPEWDEKRREELSKKMREFLSERAVEIKTMNEEGLRRLAYEVKKKKEGYFVILNFEAEPSIMGEFRNFMYSEGVIRLMIIKKDKLLTSEPKKGEENGSSEQGDPNRQSNPGA